MGSSFGRSGHPRQGVGGTKGGRFQGDGCLGVNNVGVGVLAKNGSVVLFKGFNRNPAVPLQSPEKFLLHEIELGKRGDASNGTERRVAMAFVFQKLVRQTQSRGQHAMHVEGNETQALVDQAHAIQEDQGDNIDTSTKLEASDKLKDVTRQRKGCYRAAVEHIGGARINMRIGLQGAVDVSIARALQHVRHGAHNVYGVVVVGGRARRRLKLRQQYAQMGGGGRHHDLLGRDLLQRHGDPVAFPPLSPPIDREQLRLRGGERRHRTTGSALVNGGAEQGAAELQGGRQCVRDGVVGGASVV
ncbi:hypothetical protein FGB62_19g049 [Gracilaria domingensis]|nr:hypothetical protein FGB62_19g049 [Gracilaria domingensis]